MSLDPSLMVTRSADRALAEPGAAADVVSALASLPALGLLWDARGSCRIDPGNPIALGALLAGDGWLRALHPDDRGRAADLLAAVLADRVARDDGVRLAAGDRWAVLRIAQAADGGARGALVEATHAVGDTARMARIVGGLNRLGCPTDIVQAVLDVGTATLDGAAAMIYVLSDAGDVLEAAGMSGIPLDRVREVQRIALDAPVPAAEVLRTGEIVTVDSVDERRARYPIIDDLLEIVFQPAFVVVPLMGSDGVPFGALTVTFREPRTLHEPEQAFLADVAAQCALALDRARLTAIAEHRQDRLSFLDQLSESLSSQLELEPTLTRLAELTVPRLADWCVVRLISAAEEPGPFVGAAHVDPDRVGALVDLAQPTSRVFDLFGDLGPQLESGRSTMRAEAGHRLLDPPVDLDPDTRATLDAIGVGGVAVLPLTARGRVLGGMALGNRPGRLLDAAELDLAEQAATRAATLVDNARLFHERSGVARALQDSLLPGSLPRIPGLELGARYRAAGHGLDVGGDFYDAFRTDDNWWIVAVGDVCGHGVEAAAITGLVRHTIRASAMSGVMPSAIVGRLNDMLLRHSAELAEGGEAPFSPRFCTVVVGAVQSTPAGVDIIVCLGGHPQPLVRRGDGRVTPVGIAGTLLGVTERVSLTDSVVHLDRGEALACFTDGLTDRRAGHRVFGDDGVVRALYGTSGLSAQALAERIERRAVAFTHDEPTDDMAVLTLVSSPSD